MIRATGERGGMPVVLLGLEAMNLKRMANNEPVRVNLARLDPVTGTPTGLPNIEVVIFSVEATPSEDLYRLFQVEEA